MGALLTIQEMGTAVVFAASDNEYEKLVISLANRSHKPETQILPPPKPPSILRGKRASDSCTLPGIGIRLKTAMDYAGGMPGWALVGLTDHATTIGNSQKYPAGNSCRIETETQRAIRDSPR